MYKQNLYQQDLDPDTRRTFSGCLLVGAIGVALWVVAILMLTGCSIIHYEAKPDGSTTASGYELGTTTALSGAKFSTDGKTRNLSIESANADRVEGLKQITQGLSLLIEGAVKGAK